MLYVGYMPHCYICIIALIMYILKRINIIIIVIIINSAITLEAIYFLLECDDSCLTCGGDGDADCLSCSDGRFTIGTSCAG